LGGYRRRNGIRAPINKQRKEEKQSSEHAGNGFAGFPFAMFFLPCLFNNHWFDFANYLAGWAGWLGADPVALLVLACSRGPGTELVSSLEIAEHNLITNGIFGISATPCMHPSGFGSSPTFATDRGFRRSLRHLLFLRYGGKMMLDTFGNEYREIHGQDGRNISKSEINA
jgi:hypothetical protein